MFIYIEKYIFLKHTPSMLMLVRKLALKQIFEIKTSLRLASEVSPKSRLCCHRKKIEIIEKN